MRPGLERELMAVLHRRPKFLLAGGDELVLLLPERWFTLLLAPASSGGALLDGMRACDWMLTLFPSVAGPGRAPLIVRGRRDLGDGVGDMVLELSSFLRWNEAILKD